MKRLFLILFFAGLFQTATATQTKYALPAGSLVIETRVVNPERTLVLWMQNPQKYPRGNDEIYTCPEYSRGSFYRGRTHISLVNTKTQGIINTVEIKDGEDNSFDVPYFIQRYFYKVPVINTNKEGKPQILALEDINGDGKPFEFAMYDAWACMGLNTALFGYSETQDKVIQYPIELKTGTKSETVYWIDYLFSKKPVAKGFWQYDIDYTGRGGTLDKYEIRYDYKRETFVGTLRNIFVD